MSPYRVFLFCPYHIYGRCIFPNELGFVVCCLRQITLTQFKFHLYRAEVHRPLDFLTVNQRHQPPPPPPRACRHPRVLFFIRHHLAVDSYVPCGQHKLLPDVVGRHARTPHRTGFPRDNLRGGHARAPKRCRSDLL